MQGVKYMENYTKLLLHTRLNTVNSEQWTATKNVGDWNCSCFKPRRPNNNDKLRKWERKKMLKEKKLKHPFNQLIRLNGLVVVSTGLKRPENQLLSSDFKIVNKLPHSINMYPVLTSQWIKWIWISDHHSEAIDVNWAVWMIHTCIENRF